MACQFTYSMWLKRSVSIAEPCAHLCQVGGQHAVGVRRGPHNHYGLARLTDTGEQHKADLNTSAYYSLAVIVSHFISISEDIFSTLLNSVHIPLLSFSRDSLIFLLITCMQSQPCWNGLKRTSLNGKTVPLSHLTQEEPRGELVPLGINLLPLSTVYPYHIASEIYFGLNLCWLYLSLTLALTHGHYIFTLQGHLNSRQVERGFCSYPQGEEKGKWGGPHGTRRRCDRSGCHSSRWHGWHMWYNLPCCWQVSPFIYLLR